MTENSENRQNHDRFRNTRDGRYFDSWPEFIANYATDVPMTLDKAIRQVNKRTRNLDDRVEEASVLPGIGMRDVIVPARGAAWPTFVLGSGCLSARDWPSTKIGKSKGHLQAALTRVVSDSENRAETLVFVDNLARNRSEHALDSAGLDPATGTKRDAERWNLIARTGAAAMLLTRLYGVAIAESNQIVTDSHNEQITIPKSGLAKAEVISPLEAILETLVSGPSDEPSLPASLASLAASVLHSLRSEGEVKRAHVELLSAFLWFLLTEDTFLYPDWSDLLLFEAFMDEELLQHVAQDSAWRDSQLKPRITAMGSSGPVARWLTLRLETIAENSWKSRSGARKKPTPRDEFYDTIAALLGQQADNYHSFEDLGDLSSPHRPPLPTCFITTFDLELEMAMWKRSLTFDEPRPFIVILPVVMTTVSKRHTSNSVSLRWAWREIVPTENAGDQLKELREGGSWALLGNDSSTPAPLRNTPAEWGRTPVIVRLAGSPLMNVEVDGYADLRQALLLDEYTAVSQTVLDLNVAAQRPKIGNNNDYSRGLPPVLSSPNNNSTDSYMPRYWMFLGTQLSDAGVRLRLLSNQITFAQENAMTGMLNNVAGVAINRRSRPSEREVFHWYGVDVVRADVVASVTKPLQQLHAALEKVFMEVRLGIESASEMDQSA